MSKEQRLAELKQQVQDLEAEIEQLDGWATKVRSLDSFTVDEKVELFDRLYEQAWAYLKEVMETGFRPKDGKYYLFENLGLMVNVRSPGLPRQQRPVVWAHWAPPFWPS